MPATTVRSSDFLIRQLQKKNLDKVETLSARARVYVDNGGINMEANANLIWIRDSILWVNVKKLGIEAVRALVTRDSVFVLNRLERSYSANSLQALERQYSLPEGFPLLQHLVLASAWISPEIALQSDIKENLHRLAGSNHRYTVDYRIEEGTYRLRQQVFVQQPDARVLNLQFDEFKKLPGACTFPYLRRIEAFSPEYGMVHVEIEFSDVEINVPKPYRFDIPAHYQRTE